MFGSYSAYIHRGSSWCQRTWFWFHLTTALSPKPSLNHLDVHWQRRTCTCAFLSRETLRALRATNGVFGDCGPNCLQINNKLLPGSFGLIHHLWHDYPHFMRQDLALSSRWRDMLFHAHLQLRPWHSWTSLWSYLWSRWGWNGRNWLCGLVCWAHSQFVGSNIYFTQRHANIFITFMWFGVFFWVLNSEKKLIQERRK